MSLVIGLSGAQGAGKSTLLNELKGYGYIVDDFKVSRSVQHYLGWTELTRVMESPLSMMEFQELVFTRKYENDSKLLAQNKQAILVERTFADLSAYTNLWIWRFVEAEKLAATEGLAFLQDYNNRCFNAQIKLYGATVLLPLMSHVQFELDPARASSDDAEIVFTNVRRFIERLPVNYKSFTVTAKSTADRADEVHKFITKEL
jgi:predicted ATPase